MQFYITVDVQNIDRRETFFSTNVPKVLHSLHITNASNSKE